MNHIIDTGRTYPMIYNIAQCHNAHLKNILQKCTDHAESQKENKSHDSDKARNCRILSCQNAVDLHTPQVFFAFFWLYDCFITDFLNEIKTHMGNSRCTVKPTLFFHLFNDMLQCLFFILVQFQTFHNQRITFGKLRCCKTYRNPGCLRMILNQMHDCMKAPMYRTTVFIYITEINWLRTFLIFCHMNGMLYQFINSFILCRRNRDDRDSQHILHLIDQNGTAVFPHLIHHIQRKNHRNIQFHQLHRQIQISLNIRRIYNVDDSFWMFIKHKISCYDFLAGIR